MFGTSAGWPSLPFCAEAKLHKVPALLRMQKEHLWQAENITAGNGLSVHQGRTAQPKILHNTN